MPSRFRDVLNKRLKSPSRRLRKNKLRHMLSEKVQDFPHLMLREIYEQPFAQSNS
jgi:hypothetical protein